MLTCYGKAEVERHIIRQSSKVIKNVKKHQNPFFIAKSNFNHCSWKERSSEGKVKLKAVWGGVQQVQAEGNLWNCKGFLCRGSWWWVVGAGGVGFLEHQHCQTPLLSNFPSIKGTVSAPVPRGPALTTCTESCNAKTMWQCQPRAGSILRLYGYSKLFTVS